jgi:hypothetical protein
MAHLILWNYTLLDWLHQLRYFRVLFDFTDNIWVVRFLRNPLLAKIIHRRWKTPGIWNKIFSWIKNEIKHMYGIKLIPAPILDKLARVVWKFSDIRSTSMFRWLFDKATEYYWNTLLILLINRCFPSLQTIKMIGISLIVTLHSWKQQTNWLAFRFNCRRDLPYNDVFIPIDLVLLQYLENKLRAIPDRYSQPIWFFHIYIV